MQLVTRSAAETFDNSGGSSIISSPALLNKLSETTQMRLRFTPTNLTIKHHHHSKLTTSVVNALKVVGSTGNSEVNFILMVLLNVSIKDCLDPL